MGLVHAICDRQENIEIKETENMLQDRFRMPIIYCEIDH